MADRNSQLQEIYRANARLVRSDAFTEHDAKAYYRTYIQFTKRFAGAGRRLLDVGCGTGCSTLQFVSEGFDAVGIDLNVTAMQHDRGSFVVASAVELPFADQSFDVVASYQALEHIPQPETALREMCRVVAPGGIMVVVSPNLLSPLTSVRGLVRHVWKNRPLRRLLFRDSAMPIHPAGNTIPELLVSGLVNPIRLAAKWISPHPEFTMRRPDLNPPFHSDNDACYVCNPIDLVRFFRSQGWVTLRSCALNRWFVTSWLATGTYIAAQKPGSR